ncbi:hypothetical protein HanRHA438_Chr05g0218011 [Helianthus annuus]|nr:hypothetical protein HanRHA438_Chr05g0218011 [Helianthus annuus]
MFDYQAIHVNYPTHLTTKISLYLITIILFSLQMISGKSYMQVTDVNDELRQKTLIVLGDSKEKLNSNRYLFFVHFYRGPMNSKSWNKTVTDSLGLAQFQFSMVQFWFR